MSEPAFVNLLYSPYCQVSRPALSVTRGVLTTPSALRVLERPPDVEVVSAVLREMHARLVRGPQCPALMFQH